MLNLYLSGLFRHLNTVVIPRVHLYARPIVLQLKAEALQPPCTGSHGCSGLAVMVLVILLAFGLLGAPGSARRASCDLLGYDARYPGNEESWRACVSSRTVFVVGITMRSTLWISWSVPAYTRPASSIAHGARLASK